MVAIIEKEITIKVMYKTEKKFRVYKVNESFTFCDLKEKIFEIYGLETCMQKILVRKEKNFVLVHNEHENLLNGGMYIILYHERGGAKTGARYNAHYWQVMYLIQNRIE